ncbi:hypothetical protein K8I28_08920 [bacterium]|nr:hypothetical protein [bacterium]
MKWLLMLLAYFGVMFIWRKIEAFVKSIKVVEPDVTTNEEKKKSTHIDPDDIMDIPYHDVKGKKEDEAQE